MPIIAQLTEAEKTALRVLLLKVVLLVQLTEMTKKKFIPFDELEQVTLQRDEPNPTRSKGYEFVQ